MTARLRFRSPVGLLTVEASEDGVFGLSVGDRGAPRAGVSARARAHVDAAEAALVAYFAGRPPTLPLLDLRGTPYQRRVWEALLAIAHREMGFTLEDLCTLLVQGFKSAFLPFREKQDLLRAVNAEIAEVLARFAGPRSAAG